MFVLFALIVIGVIVTWYVLGKIGVFGFVGKKVLNSKDIFKEDDKKGE